MESNELEAQLQRKRETQTFEVKERMEWSVVSLVKDILAMSNHRDGGSIVIGVEDRTFVRQGVDDRIIATYDVDKMRAQMVKFSDPATRFNVEVVSDAEDNRYVVINVASFEKIPVICRRANAKDVYPGVLYYRTSTGAVESAAISNSEDMLELILTAIQRTRLWYKDRGFAPVSDVLNLTLDEELGDL